MSEDEGVTLLLQGIGIDDQRNRASLHDLAEATVTRLGGLPLAIAIAAARVRSQGRDGGFAAAIDQYNEDFDLNKDILLKIDAFRGLRNNQQTVWTVWNTAFMAIADEGRDYGLWPLKMLTFLAFFSRTGVGRDFFQYASLGLAEMHGWFPQPEVLPDWLTSLVAVRSGEWDDFSYRQSVTALADFHLIQRRTNSGHRDDEVLTMHDLIHWRALFESDHDLMWAKWYTILVGAASYHLARRPPTHDSSEAYARLILHMPSTRDTTRCLKSIQPTHRARVLHDMGSVFFDQEQYLAASKFYTRACEIAASAPGMLLDPETISYLESLAVTQTQLHRADDALKCYVQIVRAYTHIYGEDDKRTLIARMARADMMRSENDIEGAAEERGHILQSLTRIFGVQDNDTILALVKLAESLLDLGRYEFAAECSEKAVMQMEALVGPDHPKTLHGMSVLSLSYQALNQLEASQALEERVLASKQLRSGTEDRQGVLASKRRLASIHMLQSNFDEAVILSAEVDDKASSAFGPQHMFTACAARDYGLALRAVGRADDAHAKLIEARELLQQMDDPQGILGEVDSALEQFQQAIQ
ncbi:hypothetical protein B0A48_18368 [Cryoendolithus antarcticus]|uniref:MalT-like TPR region domain-containing protein n=1 Tax=Cryoendolithus antarcticus TaxID=1507870 RepID=A0A1V8S8M0_9PEZI|nr:hypothetical protein B0A48_18368 [Cryoendolithus antarcticus]